MGIRELREELASPTGFAGQSTAMVGRQWKLEDATISALVAQKAAHAKSTQDMLKARFDKTADIVKELATAVQETPDDPILNQRLDSQTANLSRIEATWATSLGYSPQQVISESEIIWGIVDQLEKEPGEFAKKGTWNKSTLDLINKKFEQLGMPPPNPKMAQVLWEGRIAVEGYKGTALAGDAGGRGDLIKRFSMAGIAAEVLGTVPDFLSELLQGVGELSRSAWEGKSYMTPPIWKQDPYEWGDRTSREFLRKTFGVEDAPLFPSDAPRDVPTITPSDQSTKMGPFSILDKFTGTDAGLIDGFLAQEDDVSPLPGIDESMIGATAVQELKVLDEKANELTRDAAEFVRNLEAYMKEYGQDKAIRLMAGEWASLSDSEKKAVEKYLQRK